MNLIESRIFFVDEQLLPNESIIKAKNLVSDVDLDDLAFVALTEHLGGLLWTGDKELITGLKQKGYQSVISTIELFTLLSNRNM